MRRHVGLALWIGLLTLAVVCLVVGQAPLAQAQAAPGPGPQPIPTGSGNGNGSETGGAGIENEANFSEGEGWGGFRGPGTGSGSGSGAPGNASGNESGSGGGSWFEGPIIPPEWSTQFLDMTIGPVLNAMYGTPRLCIGLGDGSPGFTLPSCWPYDQLLPLLTVVTAPTFLILLGLTTYHWVKYSLSWMPCLNPHSAAKASLKGLAAIFVSVAFYLPIMGVTHAIADGLARAIAPDPGAVASNTGSLFKFSVSAMVLLGTTYELGMDFVKWIGIIQMGEWIFLWIFPMVAAPLFAFWMYTGHSGVGSAATGLIFVWIGILIANVTSAVFLFTWAMLDWGAHVPGVLNVFLSLGFLLLALVADPIIVLIVVFSRTYAINTVSSYAAGAVAGGAAFAGLSQRARERAGNARDRVSGAARERGRAVAGRAREAGAGVKSRAKAAGSLSRGDVYGAARERVPKIKERVSGSGSRSGESSGTETRADGSGSGQSNAAAAQLRRLEEETAGDGEVSVGKRRRIAHLRSQTEGYDNSNE